jgi:transposase
VLSARLPGPCRPIIVPEQEDGLLDMARARTTQVIGGAGTHGATHHAAVILTSGRHLADREFPATASGYAGLLAWLAGFGRLAAVGVEGTGSYGAGLARHLRAAGVTVTEVDRPDRKDRRKRGKSDPLDAYRAAEAVLSGRAAVVPKAGDGIAEAVRALHTIRASAVKARRAAIWQLRALPVTGPAALREQLTGMRAPALTAACTRLDPGPGAETAAQLLITAGDNPDRLRSEAAFAALRGVSPVPASSGRTRRHRLNRSGDRQANRALQVIAVARLRTDPETRAYHDRRAAGQLPDREITRCLKRYIARQIYRALSRPPQPAVQLPPAPAKDVPPATVRSGRRRSPEVTAVAGTGLLAATRGRVPAQVSASSSRRSQLRPEPETTPARSAARSS